MDVDALEAFLDGLEEAARVTAVRTIGGAHQRRLWEACEGRGSSLDLFVPADTPPVTEIINAGKNSLPVFTHFEKRFCRVQGKDDELWGYNHAAVGKLVGPGYFVAHFFEDRGEVGIDYLKCPPLDGQVPEGWPAIKPNEKGIQRFVYAGMVDYMRRVSQHVTIGRAYKGGTDALPHTFLLCRQEVA
jgi:hypothetical protein